MKHHVLAPEGFVASPGAAEVLLAVEIDVECWGRSLVLRGFPLGFFPGSLLSKRFGGDSEMGFNFAG